MGRPVPQDDVQRLLLQVVLELFGLEAKWAGFNAVDREFLRRSAGRDILEVAKRLPAGLLKPPVRFGQRPSEPFQLTLAGVVAATESQTPWDQTVFMNAVKLAATIEMTFNGPDEDPDVVPVLTAGDVFTRVDGQLRLNQLPDALADPLIKRAGYLLWGEPLGWGDPRGLGERDWSLSIDREIRHYASFDDMDTYWAIRDRRTSELSGSAWSTSLPASPARTSQFVSDRRTQLEGAAGLREQLLPYMLGLAGRFDGQIPMDQALAELVASDGAAPSDDLVAQVIVSMQTADLITEVPGERGSADRYPTYVRFTAEGQQQAEHATLRQGGPPTPTDSANHQADSTQKIARPADFTPDATYFPQPKVSAMTAPKQPEPRFQVFVSSTYEDLKVERLAVTQALLKMERCIPAGMELFSASDKPAWAVITRALAFTDYLVLIIGNRAGSMVPGESITYTEKEYNYALDNDIPVLAFLSTSNVLIRPEHQETPKQQKALQAFRERVQNGGKTAEFWSTADQLAGQATVALYKAFQDSPRPGWVRGPGFSADSGSPSPPATQTIDELQVILDQPNRRYRLDEIVQGQVDTILSADALNAGITVDVLQDEMVAAHGSRLSQIQMASGPLLKTIAWFAQRGELDTDNRWIPALSALSDVPIRTGTTALIQLFRAAGVLAFHTAGIAACIGLRDDLVGRLLGENIPIVDGHTNRLLPAAAVLTPETIYGYTTDWASKALHGYLASFLEANTSAGKQTIDRAWERWTFLYYTALECFPHHNIPVFAGLPFLRVAAAGDAPNAPSEIGRRIINEIAQHSDSHPFFAGGLGFVGDADGFEECAKKLDNRYAEMANQMDVRALPGTGGALPTGPHYPGDR